MATQLTAARQLVRFAARRYDSGACADVEAGTAKLFAFRDRDEDRTRRGTHPWWLRTNEIQKHVIAAQLVKRHPA